MKNFCFALFLLCLGCSNSRPKGPASAATPIFLDNRRIEKMAELDAFISGLDWMPLETSREAIIGNTPYQMAVCEGRLFLLYTGINSSLAIFDLKTGRFVKKLIGTGSGPGEFSKITSFNIHPGRKIIEIAAGFERKMMEFDLDGNFKTEIFCEVPFTNMANLPNGEKILYSQSQNKVFTGHPQDYELLALGENLRFRAGIRPLDAGHPVYLVSGYIFFPYGDSLRFLKPFCDTIFDVLPRGAVPRYIAHFKRGAVEQGFWDNPRLQGSRDEIFEQYHIPSLMPVFFENERLLFGVYQSDDLMTYHYLYDKKDKSVRHNFGRLWYKKWDIPLPPPLHISSEGLLFLLAPQELKTLLEEHPDPLKVPAALRQAIENTRISDNPFFLQVRFRK